MIVSRMANHHYHHHRCRQQYHHHHRHHHHHFHHHHFHHHHYHHQVSCPIALATMPLQTPRSYIAENTEVAFSMSIHAEGMSIINLFSLSPPVSFCFQCFPKCQCGKTLYKGIESCSLLVK